MTEQAKSPQDVPAAYDAKLQELAKPARTLMDLKGLPYFVQYGLASQGYVTIEDLGDRWDTPQKAREEGPEALGFKPGENGFTEESSAFVAMKLYQVVRAAKTMSTPQATGSLASVPTTSSFTGPDSTCDREHLLQTYMAKTGQPKPGLETQGSDPLLRRQFKLCAEGTIGFIPSKHIVSFLPEADERAAKRRRITTVDGFQREDEEEERRNPETRRQMERMHMVFRTNLLMCTMAFPQFAQFNLTKDDLDAFYQWFEGPSISSREPAPSVQVLVHAERNAWREILKHMYAGAYLKEAINKVQADLLFWQREVYERIPSKQSGYQADRVADRSHAYNKKGKGGYESPRDKGKGKGYKGKSKTSYKANPAKGKKGGNKGGKSPKQTWPSKWATTNPKGVAYCRNYHLNGTCNGSCGRSHNCPVIKKDNWICNAPPDQHGPSNCPHL